MLIDEDVELTFKETVGRGGYCKVIRAEGFYTNDHELIPYAVKVYKRATLRVQVNAAVNVGKNRHAGLGMRKLYD